MANFYDRPIDLDQVEIQHSFPVLHAGWEGDSEGYIARKADGSVVAVLSSHGMFYEADVAELDSLIARYQSAVVATRQAMEMLGH